MSSETVLAPHPGAAPHDPLLVTRETVIECRALSKSYRIYGKPEHRLLQALWGKRRRFYTEFAALSDVSFSVARGETVGIIGQNGSGKSTLLQILAGTLQPTGGSHAVRGRIAALLELGAGFNPEFSGRENILLNAAILGLSATEIAERYDDIVAFSEIGEFIERPVKTYSSGMFVRLAFAVAIHIDPDILIVDEALAVGDEAFQRKCFARIEALRERGATILFVSHSAHAVVDLCNRALLLDHGELLLDASPKAAVARYQRLLHAPADRREAIREEIRAFGKSDPSSKTAPPPAAMAPSAAPGMAPKAGTPIPLPEEGDEEPAAEDVSGPEGEEYFDPKMIATSTVELEQRGAQIGNVQILTLDGRKVNHLKRRETYIFRYQVRFDEASERVRFAMGIKTKSGYRLGGSGSSAPMRSPLAYAAGTVTEVEFHFRCLLMPGIYFLNAGVAGINRQTPEYGSLHRLMDAFMFRVSPEPVTTIDGTVDFLIEPSVSIVTAGSEPAVWR